VDGSVLLIITGPSGAGKGTLLRALEDYGYFCVDNLPVELLGKFSELLLLKSDGVRRGALVVDVRERGSLNDFPDVCRRLKTVPELDVSLYFLEASDDVLVRRYSETRRPHPLDATRPVREAILMERERLAPIRAMADQVIDTSHFSIHDLRAYAGRLTGVVRDSSPLLVTLISFGYKYGIPMDADMIFDVRFLSNPYFVPELKPLTGADPPVVAFMKTQPATGEFLERIDSMLSFLMPQFEKEGKSYLTVAIGCTGGRHRSVMIVDEIASHLNSERRLKVIHRDIDK
jgi:UPF0042 nucleotide-binding protein